MQPAFVTAWGVCLPNAPVKNEHLDEVLGSLPVQSSAVKRRVLLANGITQRHYAIDPLTGAATHTNATMTAAAIRDICERRGIATSDIACLACGTSSADQIIPSHASMVHAELASPPCDLISPSGVCCSGVNALKYGFLNVAAGAAPNAVATGSELASPSLRASHFEPQVRRLAGDGDNSPLLPFSNEFLRWMLSDGAGALLIEPTPRADGPSLRIEWIDVLSYASETDVCMSFGLQQHADGRLEGYRSVYDEGRFFRGGLLSLCQDVRILNERLPVLMGKALCALRQRRRLSSDDVDWLLPHYSSQFFRPRLHDALIAHGLPIPYERWFTNLTTRGNTGSAAIYIILEELMSSGRTKRGERILCIVPESARMLFGFVYLTVV